MKSDAGSECSLSRRWLLKACAAVGGLSAFAGRFAFLKFASANMLNEAGRSAGIKMQPKIHVAVIGAGAFGGWTALYLLRRGSRGWHSIRRAFRTGTRKTLAADQSGRYSLGDPRTPEWFSHGAHGVPSSAGWFSRGRR